MVQKEIKQKTKLYTIAAVLLAMVLVGSIYATTAPTQMPLSHNVLAMKNFASNDELKNYLIANGQYTQVYYTTADSFTPTSSIADSSSMRGGTGSTGSSEVYSATNIQVAGVDETDIVKTDGQYIYIIQNYKRDNAALSSIQIVKADSKNPYVVSKIDFEGKTFEVEGTNIVSTVSRTMLSGMYLSENGNKLAVLGTSYYYSSDVSTFKSFIYVYDVSNKVKPVLARNVTLSNDRYSYATFNSRMIGNYVYALISKPAYVYEDELVVPSICKDGVAKDVPSTSIYYTDVSDRNFSYNTFIGINIMDDTEQPTDMTILMGASSCMYVSANNMYVTFPNAENTEIHRIAINGANLTFEAQNVVSGRVLNQYSMDEYNNYFRIATTTSSVFWSDRASDHNNLYVLDMNLDLVGKIENLAQGERIYSARFAGDKAYLVTFEQIDPFFILDLKNPVSPKVTGELKIPGYSSYLHPYNENYVIGIGQENNSVKLSLFDVTNMKKPKEVAKYLFDENFVNSYSEALSDPKAFLFDLQKQLLVIPVGGFKIDDTQQRYGMLLGDTYVYGNSWQGVCVFHVSPENGFTFKKEIDNPTLRSLYIGSTLYTISNDQIQLNSLDDFRLIAQVIF
ncbi:MAG: beta-propeller domain-containing protein [Nitrososphaerota archaeon]|jgi:uncharacterized secreted protein with C-terminal beta-propeller domain|nr:beta-propeller domain-containing protein [Nitrososphaerota archaeon]